MASSRSIAKVRPTPYVYYPPAPTVLHQRAPPCEDCPMFIRLDDRPRRTAAADANMARVQLFFLADNL